MCCFTTLLDGRPVPKFAHLPLILKPVGKGKLSKRDGDKLGFPVFPLAYTNEKTGEVSLGYKKMVTFQTHSLICCLYLAGIQEQIKNFLR